LDQLEALQLFVRVVETGSLTKAARAIGVGQPTVSKQISLLEERLGARLLNRTSRGLSVTSAGQDYYESAVRLLDDFKEADARVRRGQAAPEGTIRVASSPAFARIHLMPRLPEFFARYPGLSVDFDISERFVSLVEDGIDVALRMGTLSDSSLVARRIGTVGASTVATPAYLDRAGTPAAPGDLDSHACIGFVHRGALTTWRFQGPAGAISVEPKGPFRSNDAEHLRAAVLAGIGIGHTVSWLFEAEIASGAVRQVLREFETPRFPLHAVCPGGRRIPSRVRVFIDFVAEICAASPHLRVA
jgi:LysR family transcriptional regulator for bpeEF and oprC